MLIDTHIHLDFDAYDLDRDELLARATEAGVLKSISIGSGSGIASTDGAIQLAQKYDQVFCSVGVHPHDASFDLDEAEILKRVANPKVVAIGETGLDFFRNLAPVDAQRHWFKFQIELAKQFQLPLIVHSREAGEECLHMLTELNAHEVGGVFHCYSEDQEFAKKLRDINFLVSFTGVVTFKKADQLRDIVRAIPLDQIMLETDGPYMAPEPFRGTRSESAHVLLIAKTVAAVKGVSLEEVGRITTENAEKLFKL